MGQYDPQTVDKLGSVVDDICEGLRKEGGPSLSLEMKQALAKRVLELHDNGITDLDELRLEVMADSLWASGRQQQVGRAGVWLRRLASREAPRSAVSCGFSMKPSFLNLFMNRFTRVRVEPIISANVS